MARRAFATVLAVYLTSSTGIAGPKPSTRIVQQADTPVKIVTYSAAYMERSTYIEEGIHHRFEFQNTSQRPIAAVRFGVVSFDAFNEFIGRTAGIYLDPLPPGGSKNAKGTWITRAYGDFAFLTGVAYVQRVRFEDGEIWTADEAAIVTELKKIQADFDPTKLKTSDPGK